MHCSCFGQVFSLCCIQLNKVGEAEERVRAQREPAKPDLPSSPPIIVIVAITPPPPLLFNNIIILLLKHDIHSDPDKGQTKIGGRGCFGNRTSQLVAKPQNLGSNATALLKWVRFWCVKISNGGKYRPTPRILKMQ